jgi:hypothetical protein
MWGLITFTSSSFALFLFIDANFARNILLASKRNQIQSILLKVWQGALPMDHMAVGKISALTSDLPLGLIIMSGCIARSDRYNRGSDLERFRRCRSDRRAQSEHPVKDVVWRHRDSAV